MVSHSVSIKKGKALNSDLLLFACLWLVVFVIYLPAFNAGLVGDFPYIIEKYRTKSFFDFINAPAGVHTFLQFVNIVSWFLLKFFGSNPLLWHLALITLHVADGLLLYKFLSAIFENSGIVNGKKIVFTGVLLYTVCPHLSEVIVWIPAYHVSLSCFLFFSILLLVQKFLATGNAKYAWIATILYFISTFATEIYFVTPLFILLLAVYYRYVLNCQKSLFQRTLVYCFIPSLLFLFFHFIILKLAYNATVTASGPINFQSPYVYLCKPLKYLFNIVFLGRFFPNHIKNRIYNICESKSVILVIYSLLVIYGGFVVARLQMLHIKYKISLLLLSFIFLSFIMFAPLDFPGFGLLTYDRYTYLAEGFIYVSLVFLISAITNRFITIIFIGLYALINVCFTLKINIYWKESATIIDRLLKTFPQAGGKTVLLLNLPDDFKGIPMIAAVDDGRFNTMLRAFTNYSSGNRIYDAVAYNMSAIGDGAHVNVLNDSLIHVTLNQWGTWWMYGLLGATSYANSDYNLNMVDEGHWYELTLKHSADRYLLLYQVGDKWKVVDWNKKNIDQY